MVWDRKQSRNSGHFWLDSNVSTLKIVNSWKGNIFSGFRADFSVIPTLFAFQESDFLSFCLYSPPFINRYLTFSVNCVTCTSPCFRR